MLVALFGGEAFGSSCKPSVGGASGREPLSAVPKGSAQARLSNRERHLFDDFWHGPEYTPILKFCQYTSFIHTYASSQGQKCSQPIWNNLKRPSEVVISLLRAAKEAGSVYGFKKLK